MGLDTPQTLWPAGVCRPPAARVHLLACFLPLLLTSEMIFFIPFIYLKGRATEGEREKNFHPWAYFLNS